MSFPRIDTPVAAQPGTAWSRDVVISMGPPGLSGHRVVAGLDATTVRYPSLLVPEDAEFLIGVTLNGGMGDVAIRQNGPIVEESWMWALGPVLCGDDGQLCQALPADALWVRQVGVAVLPTVLVVQLRPPIYLPN